MKKEVVRSIFLMMIFCSVFASANAQVKVGGKQPDERVEVNKEYDEDGNLVRYDSTYSYSYSSSGMSGVQMDSLMKQWQQQHAQMFSGFNLHASPLFNPWATDSIVSPLFNPWGNHNWINNWMRGWMYPGIPPNGNQAPAQDGQKATEL